MYVCFFL